MISRLVPVAIRRNFTIDFAASLLAGLFLAMAINFIPVVARRLGASALELSLIVSAPLFGALATPLSVYIPPSFRFRSMVLIWALARGLFLLVAFITSSGPFVLIVLLYYVLVQLPLPAYAETMRTVYPSSLRGRAMSYARAGMTFVLTVATPVAGWLMDRLGYPTPFVLGSMAGLAAAVIFSRLRPGSYVTTKADLRQVVGILKQDHGYAVFNLALMFLGVGYVLGTPLYAIVQVDDLHLSYSVIGLLGLLGSLAWMLSNLALGALLDRKGALVVMLVGNSMQVLMPLCYLVAHHVAFVAVAFIFAGVANAAGDLAWLNSVLLYAGEKRVSDYSALYMLLLGTRGLIGTAVGALLLGVLGLAVRQMLVIAFFVQLIGALIMLRTVLTYRYLPSGVTTHG